MPNVNRKDFNEYRNRSAIGDELLKLKNDEIIILFCRLIAFMEVGNHPDRQGFWEYLENICKENRTGQLVLEQVLTMTQNETCLEATNRVLDKHTTKV